MKRVKCSVFCDGCLVQYANVVLRGVFVALVLAGGAIRSAWADIPEKEDFGLNGATILEFIQSTGQEWIDTGMYITEKSGFDLDAICFNPIASPGFACVMGAEHTGGCAYWWLGTFPHYDSGGFDYAGTGQIHYNGGFITGERVFTSFRNGQIVYDPSLRLLPQLTAPDSFQSSGTLGVFADNNDQTGAKENSRTRLYGLKLYEGDVVMRDYVPCRDSNGVACLYDCVNGNFAYTSTGAFATDGAQVFYGLRTESVTFAFDNDANVLVATVSRETDLRSEWKVYAVFGAEYHGTNVADWVADGGAAREIGRIRVDELLCSAFVWNVPDTVRYIRFVAVPTTVDNIVTAGRWTATVDLKDVDPVGLLTPILTDAQLGQAGYVSVPASLTCSWIGTGASYYDVHAVCEHNGIVSTNRVLSGETLVGSPVDIVIDGLSPSADYTIYFLVENDVGGFVRYPSFGTLSFSTREECLRILDPHFTDLKYVQFNSGAYVDTGIPINDHQVECHFWWGVNNNDTHLFGSFAADPYLYTCFTWYNNCWCWGGNNNRGCAPCASPGGEHTVIYNALNDHMVYVDGELVQKQGMSDWPSSQGGTEGMWPEGGTTCSQNLLLGNRGGTASFNGYIYSFRITDRDGKVVLNYIPCIYRGLDFTQSVVGFYDLVSGGFFTSINVPLISGPTFARALTIDSAVLTVRSSVPTAGKLTARISSADEVGPAKVYALYGDGYGAEDPDGWDNKLEILSVTDPTDVFEFTLKQFSLLNRYVRFAVVPVVVGDEDWENAMWSKTMLVSELDQVWTKQGLIVIVE